MLFIITVWCGGWRLGGLYDRAFRKIESVLFISLEGEMEMYAAQWGNQHGSMQDRGDQLLQFKEKRNEQELSKSRLRQESSRTETDLDKRAKLLLKSAIRLSNEITQYRRHLLDINSPKILEEEALLNNKAVFNALLTRGVLGPIVEMEERVGL